MVRVGGEDNIELIIQGGPNVCPWGGTGEGMPPSAPLVPWDNMVLAGGPFADSFFLPYLCSTPSLFQDFQLPARTMIRDFIIFCSYKGLESFTTCLLFDFQRFNF